METKTTYHYYGDTIRGIFFIGGLIMILSYPFFSSFVKIPIIMSIVGCISLAVLGGLMNPKQKWIMLLNTIVSVGAFILFEYSAIYAYMNLSSTETTHVAFFWVNQILALFFFFASYLATKTLRGAMVSHQ